MHYINTLREGDMISEVYLCKSKITATSKTGKNYYSMQLQDKTGSVDAKVWDINNGIAHFEALNYIKVDAQVTSFNGALQLNVKRVRMADVGEYEPSDYVPCTDKDIGVMFDELLALIDSIDDTYLNKLLKAFFVDDKDFAHKFKNHSAAKTIHHGFMGGLLEHTLSVAKLCDYMSSHYPYLNRNLLVTSAIFHDIGKVDELSGFPENDYTDEGQLVGHIVMGAMMVSERIKTIEDFPKVLADELKHCILSHHGELEYGSPKKPSLIEAVALSHADNLDAKLQAFHEVLLASSGKADWIGYHKMFEANLRITE